MSRDRDEWEPDQKEERVKNCVVCKNGTTKPGKTTITLEKDGVTLVFKSVPARVCNICGRRRRSGIQIEIRQYPAA